MNYDDFANDFPNLTNEQLYLAATNLQPLFELACKNNNLEFAQFLYSMSEYPCKIECSDSRIMWPNSTSKIYPHRNQGRIFSLCCENGYYDLFRWLYDITPVKADIINHTNFSKSCENGHLDIAKWMYKIAKTTSHKIYIDLSENDDYCFRWACRNGHVDIATWLYETSYNDDNIKIKLNINASHDDAFRLACSNGHLTMAKWLYNTSRKVKPGFVNELFKVRLHTKIDINALDNEAFRFSLMNNHIDVAEYLYQLSKKDNNTIIDINSYANTIFFDACKKDAIETAKWLSSKCPITFRTAHEDLIDLEPLYMYKTIRIDRNDFMICASNNSVKMIQYLYDICKDNKININDFSNNDFDTMFKLAANNNYVTMVEWLYNNVQLKDVDYKNIFEIACEKNNYDIMDWLRNNILLINVNYHDIFVTACRKNNINLVKWLYCNIHINIRKYNDIGFIASCTNNYKQLALWFCMIEPAYMIIINNNNTITYKITTLGSRIKDAVAAEDYNAIDDFYKNIIPIKITNNSYDGEDIEITCPICLSDKEYLQIKFTCNHTVCITCFAYAYLNNKCHFKCHGAIDYDGLKLLKYE